MNALRACTVPPVDRRRRLVVLGAAGAPIALSVGCGGGSGHSAPFMSTSPALIDPFASTRADRDLPILPLDQGALDASGVRGFSLRVQRGTTQFRSGVDTPTFGYNGVVLGPALRLRTGENTTIRVRNDLDVATTVHWHGLIVPADVDGGPHQSVEPGAQWSASFEVENPASTCWFHPHPHGATGLQVVSGLAGLLIVDDPAMRASTLPDTWGVDDLALVLQDKRFTAAGQIDYSLTADERLTGYAGDHLLVNGTLGPVWHAPRQWVRLRLLNGCNARTLTLRLGNAVSMLQVANEAGLLAAPVTRASLTLAPGERAEVLANLGSLAIGQEVPLYASTATAGMGMGMGMDTGAGSNASEVTAMRIRVALPEQPNAMVSPPATLAAAPSVIASAGATVRSFSLEGGMMGSPFTINGRRFDMSRIDLAVPANTVEVWRFVNATGMAHPMHVHGVRMSMLSRGGTPPAAYEQGLRDTFVVEAMQTVAVAVQTAAQASPVPLVFHCHILEHEDAGMMGQFVTL